MANERQCKCKSFVEIACERKINKLLFFRLLDLHSFQLITLNHFWHTHTHSFTHSTNSKYQKYSGLVIHIVSIFLSLGIPRFFLCFEPTNHKRMRFLQKMKETNASFSSAFICDPFTWKFTFSHFPSAIQSLSLFLVLFF